MHKALKISLWDFAQCPHKIFNGIAKKKKSVKVCTLACKCNFLDRVGSPKSRSVVEVIRTRFNENTIKRIRKSEKTGCRSYLTGS